MGHIPRIFTVKSRQESTVKRIGSSALILAIMLAAVAMLAACGGGAGPAVDQLSSVRQRGKMVAGVKFDSKPFGYLDTDGEVKGYDIDLIRELARRISANPDKPVDVEFQQVLSSTRIIGLNLGKLDLVAATMTITPEREEMIDFTDPYYIAHQAVIVPEKSSARLLDDLSDGTILYVIGTTSEKNIRKRLPKARFKGFKSSVEAFSALKAGRGSAMTSDDTILYGFIGDTCTFRMLPERLSDEPYGMGIRQTDDRSTESFRKAINKALEDMRGDGTLKALEEKWMGPYRDLSICEEPPAADEPGDSP